MSRSTRVRGAIHHFSVLERGGQWVRIISATSLKNGGSAITASCDEYDVKLVDEDGMRACRGGDVGAKTTVAHAREDLLECEGY